MTLLLIAIYNFLFFFKFFFKNNLKFLKKILKKKDIFFKKRVNLKVLISKRTTTILRRKKQQQNKRKNEKGGFFFKKFFFKTLYNCRLNFKKYFFLKTKVRQKKITKLISQKTDYKCTSNNTFENTIVNILLRGGFFFFYKDATLFIKSGMVYVNNIIIGNVNFNTNTGDCVQIPVHNAYYKYYKLCKKFFKKKIKLIKYNSWKFFKQKEKQKKKKIKLKKRKFPKFLFLFFLFKLNTPKHLEVDFLTLTIFILKKGNRTEGQSYFINKLFSFKFLPLYNYKKIN